MADLDRRLEAEPPAALGAGVALLGLANVREARRVVAARLDPAQVPPGAIGAGDVLALAQRLVGDDLAGEPDRAERAALGAEAGLDLLVGRGHEVGAERGRELRLLEPVVATQEREHERPVAPDDGHRLRGGCEVDREQLGERLARPRLGGLDLCGSIERRREASGGRGTPRAISRSAA